MLNFKEISARLAVAAVILLYAYLVAAFCEVSLNPASWDVGTRVVTAVVGSMIAFLVAAYPFERFTR